MNEFLDGYDADLYAAGKKIEELQAALTAKINNKQQFERDWLECCDKLNEERRTHLELEEVLVKKLEASQASEKVLRDALVVYKHIADPADWSKHPAEEALAQPTNDTALKAALAAERERCASACKKEIIEGVHQRSLGAKACVEAIRALGE